MDAFARTEVNRINNCIEVLSDFEIMIEEDIAEWFAAQSNCVEDFITFEETAKAFWKEKLEQ
jgi:hypothetical protein